MDKLLPLKIAQQQFVPSDYTHGKPNVKPSKCLASWIATEGFQQNRHKNDQRAQMKHRLCAAPSGGFHLLKFNIVPCVDS